MRVKFQTQLLVLNILSALLIIIITFSPSNLLRIVLGFPFLLFFPGYVLIAAFFPRKKDLDVIERVALSFGLSIAIVPLNGLILNYSPIGIGLYSILISLTIFILVASAIAWYRQHRLAEQEGLGISLDLNLSWWRGQRLLHKVLSIVLGVVMLGAMGTVGYIFAAPEGEEGYTQFYLLGLEGQAEWYPGAFVMRGGKVSYVVYEKTVHGKHEFREVHEERGRVVLGIVNREQEEANYRVEVTIDGQRASIWLDGEQLDEIGPVVLPDGEQWEHEISFVPQHIGYEQEIAFVLYRDGEPYFKDELHLWTDVTERE